MSKPASPGSPATQIIYLVIPTTHSIGDLDTEAGRLWSKAQDIVERSAGFQRLYWGRGFEEPENVQLHIAKKTLQHHHDFLNSLAYQHELLPILNHLTKDSANNTKNPVMFIRHAYLADLTPGCKALGRVPGMPIATAVVLGTDESWDEGAWPLWTHVVRHVNGCKGVAGGKMVESLDGHDKCYLAYVAWDSVKRHDDYHNTKHFASRMIILQIGNKGLSEYGHIIFEGGRGKISAKL
ncbi:hypothetical protein F5X99DRAFT_402894 [Biscogniauxia marginata]|nr:hypothetical protein F5X99DRAFT_402894 [Biscogniauxia marginata]